MALRLGVRYALACPTSMGVRITPPERMAVQNMLVYKVVRQTLILKLIRTGSHSD